MNLMSNAFIIMIFLAGIHFVYNGILLPSIRMHLRNSLFALRDELRLMKIKKQLPSENKVIDLLHDGINNVLDRLPSLTLESVLKIKESLKNDPLLIKEINSRLLIIEKCKNIELVRINRRTNTILLYTFLANSGGLLLWILPGLLMYRWGSKIKTYTKDLIAAPSSKAEKLIPSNKFA